jgi:hypothetical protein
MALVLGVALVGLWVFWGELIPVTDGLGFGDGRTYGRLAMDFPEYIRDGLVDKYRMARVAPSFLVYLVLEALPISVTPEATVAVFRFLNIGLLVGSCYLWVAVARSWEIARWAAWIGFIGLFVNFQSLKMSLYYPTLTDTAAFALGMVLLVAFVQRRVWLTALVAVLGALTSPPLFAAALLLLVIPRLGRSSPLRVRGSVGVLAWLLALALGLGIGYWLVTINTLFGGKLVSGGETVWQQALWLSIGLVVAYLALGSRPLWASLVGIERSDWRDWLGSRQQVLNLGVRIAVSVGLVFAAFRFYEIGAEITARNTDILLERMVYEAVARPLMFLVGHVFAFGPIILVAVLLWPRVTGRIHGFGPGFVLLFLALLFLGLSSESRTITFALPFVAGLAALAADERQWTPRRVALFGAVSLVVSRVWFPINQGPIDEGPYLDFPAQYYFMNFAPWMSNAVYVIAIIALALTAIATYAIVPRLSRSSRVSSPGGGGGSGLL